MKEGRMVKKSLSKKLIIIPLIVILLLLSVGVGKYFYDKTTATPLSA